MFGHQPVLLKEVLEGLHIRSQGLYVDCTLGGAGHCKAILTSDPTVRVIGLDQDPAALEAAAKRLAAFGSRVRLVHGNFRHLGSILGGLDVGLVDGILMDIGVSSHQLDTGNRGFSYQKDASLDMRMDPDGSLTASHLVNELSAREIATMIRDYGEERWAARIAAMIVEQRTRQRIETTGELVDVIKKAIPASQRRGGPHPAKRTFQALRIAVNDELGALSEALYQAVAALKSEGRLTVITFHSLEDRIVKDVYRQLSRRCVCPSDLPICSCKQIPELRLVNRKPIMASREEVTTNPRSRSAKLRIGERLERRG